MEKSKVIRISLVLMTLLILPTILAYRTEISVQTEPDQLISINIVDPVTDDKLFNAFERANSDGKYEVAVSTAIKYININIVSKDAANVIIGSEEIMEYEAGRPLSVDLTSEETEPETTTEEETETTEETQDEPEEKGPGFVTATGQAIKGVVTSKITYYILGGIILIIVIIIVIRIIRKRTSSKDIRVRRLSELRNEETSPPRVSHKDKAIAEAERKLNEAQKEISKLKNRNKIEKLEEELKRLKES